MKKLLLLLPILLLLSGPPPKAQIVGPYLSTVCDHSYMFSSLITSSISTIVKGVAGKTIYLCGYQATNSAAGGTFQLQYGTGTNCGTGTASLTAALSVGTTAITDHLQYAFANLPQISPYATAAQNDLCVNPSASTIAAMIYYGQD